MKTELLQQLKALALAASGSLIFAALRKQAQAVDGALEIIRMIFLRSAPVNFIT